MSREIWIKTGKYCILNAHTFYKKNKMRLLIFASVFSFVECAGQWLPVQDPMDKVWCNKLKALDKTDNLISLPSSKCPKIVSVSQQVVSGVNTKYRFTLKKKQCELVVYEQSWTNTRNITRDTCHLSALKRLGGWVQIPVRDPQFINKLQQLQNTTLFQYSQVQEILQISTQIGNGLYIRYLLKYDRKHCKLLLLEQPSTNTLEIINFTCTGHIKHDIVKRQLGGWNEENPNDQEWSDKLQQLVQTGYLQSSQATIVKVQTQIVSGRNTKFTLIFNNQVCEFVLSEQVWTNTTRITSDSCNISVLKKPKLDGGWQPVTDMNSEGFKGCLSQTLDIINEKSNSLFRLVTSSVISAKQQVVAGIKYEIKLQTMDSSCLNIKKNKGLTSTECPLNIKSDMRPSTWITVCVFQAWSSSKINVLDTHMSNEVQVIEEKTVKDDSFGKKTKADSNVDQIYQQKMQKKRLLHDKLARTLVQLGVDNRNVGHARQQRSTSTDVMYMSVVNKTDQLGGDVHDKIPHRKPLIGGGDHDKVVHGKTIFGGDDHDKIPHEKPLIGGGDNDEVNLGKQIIGGDGHDSASYKHQTIENGDNNKVTHETINQTSPFGGDDHDYCHIGMFKEFKMKFNKLYASQKEEEKRFMTFCDNMRIARGLQEIEQGSAVYGATKFADLTDEEFRQYVGKKWDANAIMDMEKAVIPNGPIPDSFDWREKGAVTPVKNQGSCGSCWAFSTTGNIEGQWAVKKQKLISLSEQELVDCDKLDEGCNGGLPSNAYKEIERLGGLETEDDYSYKGADNKCAFNRSAVKVYINGSVSISSNENDMAAWLVANGPISIGINAFAMQFYMGGISHPWKIFCNPKDLDHGVLIVGYGVHNGTPYWTVKNSWGPDWGEKGYYLVYKGAGVCGLNTMCTSAVVN